MMQSTFPLLSLAIWLPIAFGMFVLAFGRDDNPSLVRSVSLVGSIASFLVTLPLVQGFDKSAHGMQFVEKASWIERFNVNYSLGIDGISVWFVLLTAFITIIVVISLVTCRPKAAPPVPTVASSAAPIASVPASPPGMRTEEERNTIGVFKAAAPATVFVTQTRVVENGWGEEQEVPAGSGSGENETRL